MTIKEQLLDRMRLAESEGRDFTMTPAECRLMFNGEAKPPQATWNVGDEAYLTVGLGWQIIARVVRLTEDGVGILKYGDDLYRTDNSLCSVRKLLPLIRERKPWWRLFGRRK